MARKEITIGIFGFGCVGQGLWNVLSQTPGLRARIKTICIKDPRKPRSVDASLFTTDRESILSDPEIDVVVELTNDEQAAYEIVTTALSRRKAVVSASKKMIAAHLAELVALQEEFQTPFLYEGSCCASIPIIRNLEEYYDNDLLASVSGIFNGSTNYILTRIFDQGLSFESALQEAQEKGFAETDPTLDVEAFDPKFKLCIILLHAFGLIADPEQVFHYGIQNLNDFDIRFAMQRGCRVKLIAQCRKEEERIFAWCLPQLVPDHNALSGVNLEFNAVKIESAFSESQFFVGKGAGGNPTGSAVLSDLSALTYDYKYEYRKQRQNESLSLSNEVELNVYLRLPAQEQADLSHFVQVKEHHRESEFQYIVGRVRLSEIESAGWKGRRDCNLIQLPEWN